MEDTSKNNARERISRLEEENRTLKEENILLKKQCFSQEDNQRLKSTFKDVIDGISEAISFHHKEGFFLDLNISAEILYGYPRESFLGKALDFLSAPFRNDLNVIKKHIKRAYEGEPQKFEFWRIDRSGKIFPTEINLTPGSYSGQKAVIAVSRDITKYSNDQETADKQAVKINSILRSIPDSLFVFDKNGNFKDVIATEISKPDFLPGELVGMNLKDVYPEEEAQRFLQLFEKCLNTGKIQTYEYQLKIDDQKMFFEARISPLDNDLMLTMVRDITLRQQYEDSMHRSEENFRHAIVESPLGIEIISNEDQTIYVNRAMLDIYGYDSIADLIKAPALKRYTPESYAEFLARKQQIKQGSKIPPEYEINIIRKDGKIRNLLAHRKDIAWDGKKRSMVIYKDITQLKTAEKTLRESKEKYKSFYQNSSVGFYRIDANGQILMANPALVRMLGYNSYIELTIKSLTKKETASKNTDHYNLIKKVNEKGEIAGYPTKWIHKDGSNIDTRETIKAIKDNYGKIVYYDGIVEDVTGHKHAERLQQKALIANESAQFRKRFIENLNHEILSPLTGIVGLAELLAKTELSENQREYLDLLTASIENIREIISRIPAYPIIEEKEALINSKVFSINSLIDNSEKIFESICHKEITFEREVSPDLPEYIKADEQLIFQVIYNLLLNAIQHTEKGRIVLKMKPSTPVEPNKPFLIRTEVEDTGIGISPESKEQLFKPVTLSNTGFNPVINARGLGLIVCQQLSEILGGEIDVESKYGEGSIFWFTFMARAAEKPEAIILEGETKKPAKTSTLNILYVEDKVVHQKVISLILQSMGHEVVTANNGKEAIEIYSADKSFDLILMDIQMPVMDGVMATKELRSKFSDLPPIVALSATDFEGIREKYIQMSMDEFLTKPVKEEDFVRLFEYLKLQ